MKFPKHGAVERGKCVVLVGWTYLFLPTDMFWRKEPFGVLCVISVHFEKVSTEKVHGKYLKMLLGSQSFLCTNAHTQILHRQNLYLGVNPIF